MDITCAVKQKAIELGFDLVGITSSAPISQNDKEILKDFVSGGFAGEMGYLNHNMEIRTTPEKLLPGAKSVICVALNYKTPAGSGEKLQYKDEPHGQIAAFACYEDYHSFIKIRLFRLAEYIAENFKPDIEFKVCVDSVPLAERSLAVRAGLGFIGKNRMLVNPKLGLKLLLGELITNIELKHDEPMRSSCAGCDRCTMACPNGVFGEDGSFDARKCVSYLTIEKKGDIESSDKAAIGKKLFGCDECIKACPMNKIAPVRSNKEFKYINPLHEVSLCDILYWDQKEFDNHLNNTTIHRLGLKNLQRNALICLENSSKVAQGTRKTSLSPVGLSRPE